MAPATRKAPINWGPFLKFGGFATLLGAGYTCYDFYVWRERNRIRAVARNSSITPQSFEVLREPCDRLVGYDVVVRYTFAEPEGSFDDNAKNAEKDRGRLGRFFNRLYRLYFTDELEDLADLKVYDESKDDPRFRTESVRTFVSPSVGDTRSIPIMDQPMAHIPSPVPSGTPKAPTASNRPTVWPKGTHLFSSMTIEPRRQQQQSILQSMLDSSTEQTFSKCVSTGRFRKDPSDCKADASALLSPYLRVMLGTFAFFPFPIPGPLRVCQLGVGGGALPMFLQQHLGSVIGQLDLVDIEPAVLRAAVNKMGLEKINRVGEMRMCAEDGATFLEKVAAASPIRRRTQSAGTIPSNSGFAPYDVLLVDLFVGSRLPSFLDNPADAIGFTELCKDALTPQGVVAFNMPYRTPEFETVCKQVFGEKRVFALPCSPNSNVVYVATKAFGDDSLAALNKRHVVRRCHELSTRYQFPFDVSASLPLSWWVW